MTAEAIKRKAPHQRKPLAKKIKFAANFDAVQTMDELKALVDKLYRSDKPIGFDIETGYSGADYEGRSTDVTNPMQFIAGLSITNDPSWARYVPLRHDFAQNLDPNLVWPELKPLLEEKVGVAHNIAFEAENLLYLDIKGDGPQIKIPVADWHDSMIQAFVLSDVPPMPVDGAIRGGEFVKRYIPEHLRSKDLFQDTSETKAYQVGLKSLTNFRYGYKQAPIHSLFNVGKKLTEKEQKQIRFNTLPVNYNVVHYACDDAYLCLQLHMDQYARIMEDPYLPQIYKMEMEVANLLTEIKLPGMSVDWDSIEKHYQMYEKFLRNMRLKVKEKFEEETGHDQSALNFKSSVQMRKLLYSPKEEGGLGLTPERFSKDTGKASTDEKALTSLRKQSPAIDTLLKYRQCIKMGEWFTLWNGLKDQSYDGKIHPSFMQARVQSGRFASAGPNVQNITKRWWFQTMEGSVADVMREGVLGEDYWTGNARDFIIASPGYRIVSFDYKSAEIQMLAALAQEDEIIQAFFSDEDFHKWTASLVFGKDIAEVTKFERQAAKAVSFGLVYGQSVGAMAQQLGISRTEAEDIRARYFARFPRLAAYFEAQRALVEEDAEVRTWMGRKAVVWDRMHATPAVRSKAERMAVNIPVQGGATGDYVKLAMIRSRKALLKAGWWNEKVRMLMNQHDSLVFEVSDELDLDEVIQILTEAVQFNLAGVRGIHDEFEAFPPMSVDWEVGHMWGSVADYGSEHILDSDTLVVELLPGAPKDVLKTITDIVVTNPGDAKVVIKSGDSEVTLDRRVCPHPDILSKIKYGDPDLKIVYESEGFVEAKFL